MESTAPGDVGRNSVADVAARAPDFTLYGLDEPWAGPGWVAGMGGPGPLATLSLGHLLADRRYGVTVKTAARDRYDRGWAAEYRDPVEAVAAEAVVELIAATWPDPEIMRQVDWLEDVYSHGSRRAREHRSWERVSWSVDGVAVDAVCWHFAGAWTGFTIALPDVYIVVTAVGVDPAAIRLRRLTDAALYGFELGVDITIGQMATGAPLPNPNRGGFHADHYAARRPTRDPG
ncbi:MAG: hypothetical protein V7637_5626 [Mycobacteriales bacterium]